MSTYVVTGAGSGIGAATARLLREQGHRVIGVDRSPCDVTADLSIAEGRADVVRRVGELSPEGIAGFGPCAGVAGLTNRRTIDAPLTRAPAGALIARVGNSSIFLVGNRRQVRAPASGRLYLGVNDDYLADNNGQFRVMVDFANR